MMQPHQPFADRTLDAAPSHLAAVIPRVKAMIDCAAYSDAVALLNKALAGWDPRTALPHVFPVDAAYTYASLLPFSDTPTAQGWARYARRAARHLYGPSVQRTTDAIEALCWAHPVTRDRDRDRDRDQFNRFLTGLNLIDPGIEVITPWRPEPSVSTPPAEQVSVYGAVARIRGATPGGTR